MEFFERIKTLLLKPDVAWRDIAAQPDDYGKLFTTQILPFTAFYAVCMFIGEAIGFGNLFLGRILALLIAVVIMVIGFTFLAAAVINHLSPRFGGRSHFPSAFKLAAYFPTPSWLAGIFMVVQLPTLGMIVGFYSLYLLWTGLAPLMQVPAERTIGFIAALIGGIIVIPIIIGVAMVFGGPIIKGLVIVLIISGLISLWRTRPQT